MTVQQYSLVSGDWLHLESIINDLTRRIAGQALGPASSPTFANITLTNLTASKLVATDSNKKLESVTDLTSFLTSFISKRLIEVMG